MSLKVYQVDAFAESCFEGNPAAVCLMEKWLDDTVMQNIAMENNLSETAFLVGGSGKYELRWFTPVSEVDLCGHATLASAWVLHNEIGDLTSPLRFYSRSGELRVTGSGDIFTLDFPVQRPQASNQLQLLAEALGVEPVEVLVAEDFLVVVDNEETVVGLQPDFALLKALPKRGVMVTAPGNRVDFVSRWFGPKVGVNEDPVTGSAHTTLTPYWADKLGKKELTARQVSARGGNLLCAIDGERVYITGSAVKFMEGEIYL